MQYVFTGTDRSGAEQNGITTEEPWTFIAGRFSKGWRELTVWRPEDRESPVGEIGPDYETGRRTWWSEEPEGRVSNLNGLPAKGTPAYEVFLAAIEVAVYPALKHGATTGSAQVSWDRVEQLRTALESCGIDWREAKRKQDAS